MSKELEALEELKNHTDWTWKDAENYEIVKNALTRLEKLEKTIELVNKKDIELNLLKGTFKFDNTIGYNYYLKIWCITDIMLLGSALF